MSKHNNVNPGQYKVAGRERPGEDIDQPQHKARLTQRQPPVKAGHPKKPTAPSAKGQPK